MKSSVEQFLNSEPTEHIIRTTMAVRSEDLAFIDAMCEELGVSRSHMITRMLSFAAKADYVYLEKNSIDTLERIIDKVESDYPPEVRAHGPLSVWAKDFHGEKLLDDGAI